MSKSLVIIRGLPGSGKSTVSALLSEGGKYPVYGIDDYFTDENGRYQFDFKENYKAYSTCQSHVEQAMQAKKSKIFVDNVFSLEWEMVPYFELAKKYEYMVFVMTLENRHHGKNIHGIDEEQLEKMASKYKVILT
jgi:cytidylate kinase